MPELCRFYGIIIRMFFNDHAPPHFHAFYGEYHVLIDIESLSILRGHIPPRARGLVVEWASLHQEDLREAWNRAERREPLGTIASLE